MSPRRGGRHYVALQGAENAMQAFKMEVAKDLGLADLIASGGGFKNLTTEQVGQIGGEMVRRSQLAAEYAILQRYNNREERLMPPEVLPPLDQVRPMTNNGNVAVSMKNDLSAPMSGQTVTKEELMQPNASMNPAPTNQPVQANPPIMPEEEMIH